MTRLQLLLGLGICLATPAMAWEQVLIDNASFVPLVHPITNAVVSKDLKGDGTLPNDLGFTPLRQLGLYFYTHVTK